ncbi:hypothetical protein SUGI_0096850 [Cryptomeria japonica]|nr:hypothetical protein SUGI_0096850 [Cryptomeria japonica]
MVNIASEEDPDSVAVLPIFFEFFNIFHFLGVGCLFLVDRSMVSIASEEAPDSVAVVELAMAKPRLNQTSVIRKST